MKIFTTLAIIATFGLVWGCSSDDSSGSGDAGTGATGGGGTGATGGMAGMGAMGGMGATGGTGATGGAAGGGGTGGGSACGTCMQANCATEFGACTANADCMAIFTCAQTNNCTDQACVDGCITANPNGKTDFDAVYACVSQNCATECGG